MLLGQAADYLVQVEKRLAEENDRVLRYLDIGVLACLLACSPIILSTPHYEDRIPPVTLYSTGEIIETRSAENTDTVGCCW